MDLSGKKMMVILFLAIWMISIMIFALISYFCRFIHCRRNGEIVIKRDGQNCREQVLINCMVTKRVQDYTVMNGRCEHYSSKTEEYSEPKSGLTVIHTQTNTTTLNEKKEDNNQIMSIQLKSTLHDIKDLIPKPIAQSNRKTTSYENEDKVCMICLEQFKVGELVSWSKNLGSCSHVFHTECLTEWLRKKNECPYCRRAFYSKDDLDLRIYGCRGMVRACFGDEESNQRRTLSKEIKNLQEYREGANFCANHGLIFPPK